MQSISRVRLKQTGWWITALALGLICGRLLHSSIDGSTEAELAGQSAAGLEPLEGRSQRNSLISSTSRYLWQETAGLRDLKSFDVEVNRLYRESRSPLRARSLQSHRVQNSTFEEWEQLFSEGKVIRHEILKEVGAYLAQQDPDKALQLLFNQRGRMKFKNLEQYYALRDSIIATITRTDPEKVLDVFRGIGREGGYMDNARFFSQSWAQNDPRAAAERFDELMLYRNMGLDGATPQVPLDEFAGIIMKSWISKDRAEARDYLEDLPTGPKRDALQAAFDELNKSPSP